MFTGTSQYHCATGAVIFQTITKTPTSHLGLYGHDETVTELGYNSNISKFELSI